MAAAEQALETEILCVRGDQVTAERDRVAVERPLEIRVRAGGASERVIATTMRTPGEDIALAIGFLYAERVIAAACDVLSVDQVDEDAVRLQLPSAASAALDASARTFVTSAACGVCGRGGLDAINEARPLPMRDRPRLDPATIHRLPAALRTGQLTFDRTGGLHAAGLFTADGVLRSVHEDVGRHNAVDKLVGRLFQSGALPASDAILVVSGRASFELVQKAEVAGIPVLAAVGAPSSLAIERAARADMTLLGFVRNGGFNVYSGRPRLGRLST
jgi:FdhD protein